MVLRSLCRLDTKPVKSKMPITLFLLHMIQLHLDLSSVDNAMIWAAWCTAFFGFLRAGEFTTPVEGFDANRHLSLKDISVEKSSNPDYLFLRLRFSKTDQFGKGCTVRLARSSGPICPVQALLAYLWQRGNSPGPLFVFQMERLCPRFY